MRLTVVCLAVAVLCTAAGPAAADVASAPQSAYTALKLVDVEEQPFDRSLVAGRTAVVAIWATWCPSCRDELPELVAMLDGVSEKQAVLLPVSVDRKPRRGARYLEKLGFDGLAAFDPGARSSMALGIDGIPTVLVIDAEGREVARVVGSGAEQLAQIKTALARSLGEETLHVD